MIKIEVTGSEKVIAKLQGLRSVFQKNVRMVMEKSVIGLHRHVVMNKLHGQVLHVRTGRLANSINWNVRSSGSQVTGTVGTGVEYAAVHEYGFHGMVRYKTEKRIFTDRAQHIMIRINERMMNMPERSFLRSALRDKKQQIIANMGIAVADSIAEVK